MERYKIIKEVGNGTFGTVWRALNKQSGEVVAIKKMKKKYYSWEECINMREVKSLRKMNHPNIVKLKEVIRENHILYFVFEYMEYDLYQLMKGRGKPFSEVEVRNLCYQVFQGLSYMHRRGYFHRDLKPENLMVSKDVIKIADFGLAREINSKLPYTEYVSTRWYRAPEVLLQSPMYNAAVDMWAMGAIIAEMFTLRPLFPGLSEADEIQKICSVLGAPTGIEWAEGLELANAINYQFPQVAGVHLPLSIPSASNEAINLIMSLCSWDPCKRPTAMEALQHPFFQSCFYIPPSLCPKDAIARTPPSVTSREVVMQKSARRCSAALSNSKPTMSFSRRCSAALSNSKPAMSFSIAKSNATLGAGAQRKLEMTRQDSLKSDKLVKDSPKQPRDRPPMKNGPVATYTGKAREVSDAADKLADFTISSGRQPAKHNMAPPLRAGGWHGRSDLFLRRPHENITAKGGTRKVAG